MRKSNTALVWGFTIVLILCCLFLVWFVPTRSNLDFQLADIEKSLDTSRGRERKQQYEYDEVVAELPRIQAELAQTQPLADEAAAAVAELKEKRKDHEEKLPWNAESPRVWSPAARLLL